MKQFFGGIDSKAKFGLIYSEGLTQLLLLRKEA
jgi:hypothetical protein